MRKGFFVIFLLIGIIAMNSGIFCQSLCMMKHSDMTNHLSLHNEDAPVCPTPHISDNKSHHQSNHIPEDSIKCDCPSDNDSLFDNNLNLSASADLTPYLQVTSNIQPYSIVFTDNIPIPSERPPKILA